MPPSPAAIFRCNYIYIDTIYIYTHDIYIYMYHMHITIYMYIYIYMLRQERTSLLRGCCLQIDQLLELLW